MFRSSLLLALAGAAFTTAQGYSTECTDTSFSNAWLVATCPRDDGSTITSSVYLNSKLGNDNGNLAWVEDGKYRQSCEECTLLEGATLQCKCRIGGVSSSQTTTISLEEHISNYNGHLLSNQSGEPTVPSDSPTPVLSNFGIQIELSTIDSTCSSGGGTLSLNNPGACAYLPLGVDSYYQSGITSGNEGWEIVVYSDTECAGEVVHTLTEEDDDQCVVFEPSAMAFLAKPLWNADY